ncbi:MAG: bifunctional 4-hydroxy-2-oxoglutarate aldolase/2-dehydro-3-deoxy-phosphogluconate aldolase [Pseudomonadota bacterium]|nr:bifunctional 4-hydroxy-2-oxoglutarate aldolase/2-dehydro-3-deoxy-phosphogluconate aldolase [Pseudomonadota bacterium]
MPSIRDILNLGPVMPVIVIDDSANAVPLARALLEGGIKTIEITLRTPAALDSIRAVADACPDITVGAGTVTAAELAAAAKDAGAAFAVSPGTTSAVIGGCATASLPLLPGASSASEMMALNDQGFDCVKFFPANAAGGTAFIKALASPLPYISVCPTGGITEATAPEWLALANVPCVGGSWVAPRDAIAEARFEAIASRARTAAAL